MKKRVYLLGLVFLFFLVISNNYAYAQPLCNCEVDGDCGDPNYPTCSTGSSCTATPDWFKLCVPEFSDYAGIAALIGAIIIPTIIYRFKKKKE